MSLAAITWARTTLAAMGYGVAAVHTIVSTAWSSVYRIDSDRGAVYLKQAPKMIAYEAEVMVLLKQAVAASVPTVLAVNQALSCFLMLDAGVSLRRQLQQQFVPELLSTAVTEFTTMQLAMATQLEPLLALGVPDWRLHRLAKRFADLAYDQALLAEEGFTTQQQITLQQAVALIDLWCQQLAAYALPESIMQPDFHDNNIVINAEGRMTWLDLGEVLIAHPLFMLLNFLWQIKKHHGLANEDLNYQSIKQACFSPYRQLVSCEQDWPRMMMLADRLNYVYHAAYHYRFMHICTKPALQAANYWRLQPAVTSVLSLVESYFK